MQLAYQLVLFAADRFEVLIGELAPFLSEAERALLAERLLETLEPEFEELTEDQLAAELDRRQAEIEQGVVKPIPWSQVRFEK